MKPLSFLAGCSDLGSLEGLWDATKVSVDGEDQSEYYLISDYEYGPCTYSRSMPMILNREGKVVCSVSSQ